jgi:hypothetical protein
MAEEVSRLGITHAGFAMTSLPHKVTPKNYRFKAALSVRRCKSTLDGKYHP